MILYWCIVLSSLTAGVIAQDDDILFPFGSSGEFNDTMMLPNEDDGTRRITISNPFKFSGMRYDEVFVSINGIVSFGTSYSSSGSDFPVDGAKIIAPFWSDIDIRIAGNGYYRTSDIGSDQTTCNEAERAIRSVTPEFHGRSLLTIVVVTWVDVPRFVGLATKPRNTFQVLIGTDGELTYVIFSYKEINWTALGRVGFNDGDSLKFLNLPGSPRSSELANLVSTSNIGVPGRWIYEVSESFRELTAVDCQSNPCLNGGTCENNGCSCSFGFQGFFCHLVNCSLVICMNNGTCSNDECHCSPGFTGYQCEDIDCDSANPCLNGAICEDGSCTCPAGFEGNLCQDKLTSVECGSRLMTVIIDKSLVPGDAAGVHFRNQSCSGVESSSSTITLSTDYNQCGTTVEEDDTTITFTNVITYAKPGSEDGTDITREYHMQVQVDCCLNKEEILSDFFRPQLGKVAFSDKGTGDFTLTLQRFQTDIFDAVEVDTNSVVWQGQELFFAVDLKSVPDVGMVIDGCWSTTTANSNSDPRHSLISAGCPDDGTVLINRMLGLDREGFSFQAFAFVGDYTEVYIHCAVKVCVAEKAQSIRDAGCQPDGDDNEAGSDNMAVQGGGTGRKRRSSSFISTRTISNGPISIRRSTSDMASMDSSSYNPFGMLLLGMIATVVAMATLMGVVRLVRRTTDINYQRVPMESMGGI